MRSEFNASGQYLDNRIVSAYRSRTRKEDKFIDRAKLQSEVELRQNIRVANKYIEYVVCLICCSTQWSNLNKKYMTLVCMIVIFYVFVSDSKLIDIAAFYAEDQRGEDFAY